MAGLKEIQLRLTSVKNTKKITYAMKLVSAAKLKKAEDAVRKSRDYTNALYKLLGALNREQEGSDFAHPLMEKREVKNIRLLIIGGGRGLAGGYNTNVNRRVEILAKELTAKYPGATIHSTLMGKKVGEYYRRVGRKYTTLFDKLSEEVLTWPIDEVCREIENEFVEGKTDLVYMVYTKFKSAMTMTAMSEKLLPMDPSTLDTPVETEHKPILFEPSPQEVFAMIVPRIFRTLVRQAGFDAKASEHGSRMTAMDSATKNAGELTTQLQLKANKLRQSKITAELLDIIGGSEAQS